MFIVCLSFYKRLILEVYLSLFISDLCTYHFLWQNLCINEEWMLSPVSFSIWCNPLRQRSYVLLPLLWLCITVVVGMEWTLGPISFPSLEVKNWDSDFHYHWRQHNLLGCNLSYKGLIFLHVWISTLLGRCLPKNCCCAHLP